MLVGKGRQGQVLRLSPRRYGLPESLPTYVHVSRRGRVRVFGCTAEFTEPAGVNFYAPLTIVSTYHLVVTNTNHHNISLTICCVSKGLLAMGEHLQLLKMAASGWSPNDGNDDRVLDAAIWTDMVKAFCTANRFALDGNLRDNPRGREKDPHELGQLKGLWCASHVEKKLAIYHLVQV